MIFGEDHGDELRERDEKIARLIALLEKAREELDFGTAAFKQITETMEACRAEHAATLGQLTKCREALAFYADEKNWKDIETGIGMHGGPAIDFGLTAREALK
jgi:hypothetical protein